MLYLLHVVEADVVDNKTGMGALAVTAHLQMIVIREILSPLIVLMNRKLPEVPVEHDLLYWQDQTVSSCWLYRIVPSKHPWVLAAQAPKIEGGRLHGGGT